MGRYRKKPVEIEAVQVRWSTWGEVCELVGDNISPDNPAWEIGPDEASDTCGEVGPGYIAFHVVTTHGDQAVVRHGDWVIPDSTPGTFYPCKPDIFEATYEPADEGGSLGERIARAEAERHERAVQRSMG